DDLKVEDARNYDHRSSSGDLTCAVPETTSQLVLDLVKERCALCCTTHLVLLYQASLLQYQDGKNVVLNTGVPCCPRLCLLVTALDFPVWLCSVLAALDGSALCLLPWTALLCACCPGRLCSVPWTALLCACCFPGWLCSVHAAALDGSAPLDCRSPGLQIYRAIKNID
ncbi:hypothetical protein Hamer_G022475, partial [Homarus americanus]